MGESGFRGRNEFEDMVIDDAELARELCQDEREVNEEELRGEAREAKAIPDVKQPTKQERIHHELTHMQYRTWCNHCVRGRATATPHRKSKRDEERGVSRLAIDYFFPAPNMTCIAMRDADTQATFATEVPKKGGGQSWVVKQLRECIDSYWGKTKVVIRSDGENAIKDLKHEIQATRRHITMLEQSPTGESQSNGLSEQSIREVEGVARTWRSSVEGRYEIKLGNDHPLISWIVKYAGDVITRHKVGLDGKTPYERLKGWKSSTRVVPFGETVLWQPLKSAQNKSERCKMDGVYEVGIWAGINNDNGAYYILTDKGVCQARSIRRLPDSEKHDKVVLAAIRGKPWDEKGDEGRISEDMESDKAENVKVEESKQYRIPIMKRQVEKYGFTEGCLGCRSISIRAKVQQSHNEE